jgi:hypothetical protein
MIFPVASLAPMIISPVASLAPGIHQVKGTVPQ